jgi:hypothetical protein
VTSGGRPHFGADGLQLLLGDGQGSVSTSLIATGARPGEFEATACLMPEPAGDDADFPGEASMNTLRAIRPVSS